MRNQIMQIQEKPTSGKLIREVLFKENINASQSVFQYYLIQNNLPQKKKKKNPKQIQYYSTFSGKVQFLYNKNLEILKSCGKKQHPCCCCCCCCCPLLALNYNIIYKTTSSKMHNREKKNGKETEKKILS